MDDKLIAIINDLLARLMRAEKNIMTMGEQRKILFTLLNADGDKLTSLEERVEKVENATYRDQVML